MARVLNTTSEKVLGPGLCARSANSVMCLFEHSPPLSQCNNSYTFIMDTTPRGAGTHGAPKWMACGGPSAAHSPCFSLQLAYMSYTKPAVSPQVAQKTLPHCW